MCTLSRLEKYEIVSYFIFLDAVASLELCHESKSLTIFKIIDVHFVTSVDVHFVTGVDIHFITGVDVHFVTFKHLNI